MKFLMDFIILPSKAKNSAPKSDNTNMFMPIPSECSSDTKTHSCANYVTKVLNNLNSLRLDNRFCDVEIVAGNKIFRAHRTVLAASSPYFHAMFTGGLCEKDQQMVELHGISAYVFEILLDFIYSGEVNMNQNNVQELMIAADMFELEEVVVRCSEFLIQELHPPNALGIYRFACDHNWMNLSKAAFEYIENNFSKVCQEDEFYDLDNQGVTKLLQSENLRIDSELQVFNAALRWITYDILERRQYVFELLRYVRLSLLSLGTLEREITHCIDSSLRVALKSIHSDLINHKGCLVPLNVSPRKCVKKDIYVIGGSKRELHSVWDRGLEMNFVATEKFDPFTKQWQKVPDMIENRLVPGVASLNGQIYVAGGEVDSHILSSCERFDLEDNRWTQIAKMAVSRCEFGLCAFEGYLYAMGGWVDIDICGSIERYDPRTDDWCLVGSLPEPRFSMGLVSYKDLIYMVGGCSLNQRNLQDLKSYNPYTGEWKNLASMSIARFQMGVAVLDDYLYVVGGTHRQQVLNSVERYSFKTGKWSTVPPMSLERSGPAVAAMDGRLYVIGGAQIYRTPFYRAQCTIASVECFDPETNTWSDCPPLSETRSEAGAVVNFGSMFKKRWCNETTFVGTHSYSNERMEF